MYEEVLMLVVLTIRKLEEFDGDLIKDEGRRCILYLKKIATQRKIVLKKFDENIELPKSWGKVNEDIEALGDEKKRTN